MTIARGSDVKAIAMSSQRQPSQTRRSLVIERSAGRRQPRLAPRDYARKALGALLWRLFRASAQSQREWLYPAEPPVVKIDGVDPLRILVIGDAPAAGCGVLIHELGLAGFLARHVAEQTKRGVVVSVNAHPAASARSTRKELDDRDLYGYDSIVLMLATTDAFCLTGRRSWHDSMTSLVLSLKAADAASVFVTNAASMHLTSALSPFARRLTGNHARLLNIETSLVCSAVGVPMICLDAASDLTSRTYAKWGKRIGEHVVRSAGRPHRLQT